MVLDAKHLQIELSRCRANCAAGRLVPKVLGFVALWSLLVISQNSFAQEQEPDVIDAFAPIDASAGAFHNEKFHEAERALLEGLSGRDTSSEQVGSGKPVLHNVSTTSKTLPKRAASELPAIAAVPEQPTVLEQPSPRDRQAKMARPQLNQPVDGTQEQETARIVRNRIEPKPLQAAQAKEDLHVAVTKSAQKPVKATTIEPDNQTGAHEAEIRNLRRELTDTKSALAAAELEISRLSAIIQESSRARLSFGDSASAVSKAPKSVAPVAPPATKQLLSAHSALKPPAPAVSSAPTGDLQVATISVDKADLRLGPGRNHSALMSLRRGSRLAVEARQGEWYRVFAPNGQRAWIHSSLVRFGDGAARLNDGSSVKVRGYDSKLE
jgi:hypothetical protein